MEWFVAGVGVVLGAYVLAGALYLYTRIIARAYFDEKTRSTIHMIATFTKEKANAKDRN